MSDTRVLDDFTVCFFLAFCCTGGGNSLLNMFPSSSGEHTTPNPNLHRFQKEGTDLDETMVTFDVTSLFICIPASEPVETVRKRLQPETALYRTELTSTLTGFETFCTFDFPSHT